MVTVAICTRNRAALLGKAIRSVLSQANPETEILIVDNGSTDDTARLTAEIAAASSMVNYLQESAAGLSHARNTALRMAKGEWVVFLDDDATVEPGWLATYAAFFANPPNPHAGCVGGPILPVYEVPPPAWLPDEQIHPQFTQNAWPCRPGENLTGCNFAVRREPSLAIGGFNHRLGHRGKRSGAYEEVDLTERLQHAGWQSWWLDGARVRHLVAAERLKLGWQIGAAFRLGNCSAIRRLGQKPDSARRAWYALIRMLAAPIHFALKLLAALAAMAVQNRRKACKSLLNAASVAGFAWQLVRYFFQADHG